MVKVEITRGVCVEDGVNAKPGDVVEVSLRVASILCGSNAAKWLGEVKPQKLTTETVKPASKKKAAKKAAPKKEG